MDYHRMLINTWVSSLFMVSRLPRSSNSPKKKKNRKSWLVHGPDLEIFCFFFGGGLLLLLVRLKTMKSEETHVFMNIL